MRRILAVAALSISLGFAPRASAGSEPAGDLCYWCIRDAIYADVSLIDHLEANPDIDESAKGPEIVAARADIHRLRALLGPLLRQPAGLCCYSRPRLYVR
jgi:hypothetical protein